MTEEIIIDGVNVAECDAYKDKHCKDKTSIMFCDTNLCSNYPNCYYKQFKRLEQENKELKEQIQFHNKENSNLLAERNALQIGYDETREVREHYHSVLEEIREIAEKYKNMEGCRIPLGAIKTTIDEALNEQLG